MSQAPVRLIPLNCARCQAALPARPDEVAWACPQCGQGLLLDDARGLTPMNLFFSAAIPSGRAGRPFWVTQGQVTIAARDTYKGNESRAARAFWEAPRLFFVPAWEASLEEVLAAGGALLRQPLTMQPGSPAPFLPVVTPPGDVQPLAEFLVVSLEADRRDAMRRLDFSVALQPPQLWILA